MGTQDGLIVPGYMEHALKENTVPTRNLQMYAKVLSKAARLGTTTDGQALVDMAFFAAVSRGALHTQDSPSLSAEQRSEVIKSVVLHDLKRVLVGDGWTSRE